MLRRGRRLFGTRPMAHSQLKGPSGGFEMMSFFPLKEQRGLKLGMMVEVGNQDRCGVYKIDIKAAELAFRRL